MKQQLLVQQAISEAKLKEISDTVSEDGAKKVYSSDKYHHYHTLL